MDEDTYELMKNTVLLDITTIDPDKNMSEDSLKQFEQKYRGTPEQVLEKKIKNQNSNRKIYQKLFGNGIAPTVLVIDVNTNKIFEDQLIDEKSNKIKSYPSLENLIISAKKISNLPNNEVPNYIKLSELKMVDDLDLDTYIDYVDDTNSWKNRARSSSTNSTVTTERPTSAERPTPPNRVVERPNPVERPTLPNRVVERPKRR